MSKALLTILAASVTASASTGLPRVLGIVGHWEIAESRSPIHFGDPLHFSDDVRCTTRGSLTILFESEHPVSLKCDSAGQRTNLLELFKKNSQGSVVSDAFGRFFSMISLQFNHEPAMYIAAVSRAFGEPELSETVLDLQGNRVDLRSALGESPAGSYPIIFMDITSTTTSAAPSQIAWQPGTPVMVTVPPEFAKRGLVKIAIADPEGGYRSTAWALLSGPDSYAKDQAQFQEGLTIVKDWPGGESAQASRSALRAYLRALANTP